MNLEQEILSIKRTVQRIEQHARPQNKWVPASWIMDLTGWDRVKMIAARRDGVIEFKEVKDKGRKIYKYNLASLPEMLIKNTNHEPEIIAAKATVKNSIKKDRRNRNDRQGFRRRGR